MTSIIKYEKYSMIVCKYDIMIKIKKENKSKTERITINCGVLF